MDPVTGAAAISTGGSLLGGFMNRLQQRGPSAQERGAFGAGLGQARQTGQAGAQLFGQGLQNLSAANNVLLPALTGDRAAVNSLTQTDRAREIDLGRGADRAIAESTRGGVGELAQALNRRDTKARIGEQASGLRAAALNTSANLGLGASTAGLGGMQASGALFSQIAQALQSGRLSANQTRALFEQLNDEGGASIGGGLFEILRGVAGRGRGFNVAGAQAPRQNIGQIFGPLQSPPALR